MNRPRRRIRFRATMFSLALLLGLLCAAALLPLPVHAQDGNPAVRLFRDYALDMARREVLARAGAYDCSDLLGPDAVCMDQVRFLDQEWDMDFSFSSNGLRTVSLRAPFSRELYARAFAALDERFELVALQSDAPQLDLVALWRGAADSGEASRRMAEYEAEGMARSNLVYVFLERGGVHEALQQARDLRELLADTRPGTRSAGLALRKDGAGSDWIVLQFDAVRRDAASGMER